MMDIVELKKRVDKLPADRRRRLAAQLATPEETNGSYKGRRVVAYITTDPPITDDHLRAILKSQLPAYMVPVAFVKVEQMPRLPNGKINRHALPPPPNTSSPAEGRYIPPRSDVEQRLVAIWEEVLDIHPVGIHDNFFEIGGDSILSIQIISRARKAGIVLGPNQLFEHQTIAELCLFIQPETAAMPAVTNVSSAPLTPIQHWFFEEHKNAPHHWNQVMVFTIEPQIPVARIADAIAALKKHHDALRLTFTKKDGGWHSVITESEGERGFRHIDLRKYAEKEQKDAMASESKSVQQSVSLAEGPLFQALFFECQPLAKNQLMLIAHHLLVDAVSWQIISEDLRTLLNKHDAILTKTIPFQSWSEHLTRTAERRKFNPELSYWQQQLNQPEVLPTDLPMKMPVMEDSIETVSFVLETRDTGLLLKDALSAYRMRPDEILVTAFLRAVEKWCALRTLTVWFERHGRQSADLEIDLTNTVGWFTAFYPQRLSHEPEGDAGVMLKRIKEQLRQVPNGGVGYGVLRYLGDAPLRISDPHHQHPIIFNYLGNQAVTTSGPIGGATMALSGSRATNSERYSQLEINSYILNGQLQMQWSFSRDHYRVTTIERLVDHFSNALRELIDHCVTGDGGYTPSDFPEAGLTQEDLDALLNKL